MTGYGSAEGTVNNNRTYLVEVRSLNGKNIDINLRIPPIIKPYEFEIRNLIKQYLVRGSVECTITIKDSGNTTSVKINTALLKTYYSQLNDVATELDIRPDGALAALLKIPDVISPVIDTIDETEWNGIKQILTEALVAIDNHRQAEGAVLGKELEKRISAIESYEREVDRLAPLRQKKIKTDIERLLEEHVGKENLDSESLEREMIYYIEKIDIREEQVRLRTHCKYFKEILANSEEVNGKKLGFILQEIGREINTTGSKAYDPEIQKQVVHMKDELEKAKEQTFNVL